MPPPEIYQLLLSDALCPISGPPSSLSGIHFELHPPKSGRENCFLTPSARVSSYDALVRILFWKNIHSFLDLDLDHLEMRWKLVSFLFMNSLLAHAAPLFLRIPVKYLKKK